MASAQDIQAPSSSEGLRRSVSHSWDHKHQGSLAHNSALSTSPLATFLPRRSAPKALKPFNTQDIKILLLENVNQTGRDILTGQGYQVEVLKTSLPEEQLIEKIR